MNKRDTAVENAVFCQCYSTRRRDVVVTIKRSRLHVRRDRYRNDDAMTANRLSEGKSAVRYSKAYVGHVKQNNTLTRAVFVIRLFGVNRRQHVITPEVIDNKAA